MHKSQIFFLNSSKLSNLCRAVRCLSFATAKKCVEIVEMRSHHPDRDPVLCAEMPKRFIQTGLVHEKVRKWIRCVFLRFVKFSLCKVLEK